MSELSAQQIIIVASVYVVSILPVILLGILYMSGKLPRWVAAVYIWSFIVCALGWEIWFTFGLWDGAAVSERRPPAMNLAIPQYANWALNSLYDAACCLFGLLLVWLAYGRGDKAFRSWHWGAFLLLLAWFVAQNVGVELFIYHAQLAQSYRLSWAPLTPAGPWWNPTIFSVFGRSVRFQTQIPWVLMTPLFYYIVLACYGRFGNRGLTTG